jgi:MioC protein
MSSFQIIVGSMLGGTEYVAEACEETLQSLEHQTTLHLQPKFDGILTENQIWLVCTSTHGAGDYPDNIHAFIRSLEDCEQDLSSTSFLTIGVGDSNYDTYCLAAKNIEKLLISKGLLKITALKTIDMDQDIDPEVEAQEWILSKRAFL